MRKLLIITLSALSLYSYSQNKAEEQLFRKSVETLASDEFGGRKPFTKYEEKTINYIAREYKKLGLQPAANNTYFQQVPMVEINSIPKDNKIVVKGKKGNVTLNYPKDVVVWSRWVTKDVKVTNASFVFAGFGINAPEYGWNDYDGIDVKGKIVIVLVNDPGYYDSSLFRGNNMTYYGRWTYKCEEAARQGAAGVFIVHDTAPAAYGWDVVQSTWARVNLNLYTENDNKDLCALEGWISGNAASELFKAAGLSIEQLSAEAKQKGFRPIPLQLKSTIEYKNEIVKSKTANVAAILPGTDLKDEYIIYSAHWDHFGIGKPIDGDSIYRGAVDNASGVAGLFVLADRFSKLPERPRRSILFLSVTAEEAGLLGSEYYNRNPLVPLSKTVANLNMDAMIPIGKVNDVVITGKGESELDQYIQDAAAAQGRITKAVEDPSRGGYYRSDHFSFAKAGVPVVAAGGGVDSQKNGHEWGKNAVAEYRSKHYHKPSDKYDSSWDVEGIFDDINLIYSIGLRLANESYFPKWSKGILYQNARDNQK